VHLGTKHFGQNPEPAVQSRMFKQSGDYHIACLKGWPPSDLLAVHVSVPQLLLHAFGCCFVEQATACIPHVT